MSHSKRAQDQLQFTFPANTEEYAPWVATYGLRAPYGECQCGCGQPAPIAVQGMRKEGYVAGEPRRFIQTHNLFRHFPRGQTDFTVEDRFWTMVDKRSDSECWLWLGRMNDIGYGYFWDGKRSVRAHRFSYELHYGSIADSDLCVCHNCPGGDNPLCVNPAHLWLGTRRDNARDMVNKGRHYQPPTAGEDSPRAKLTRADVLEIRRRYNEGEMRKVLASEYGVTVSNISAIVKGRSWANA